MQKKLLYHLKDEKLISIKLNTSQISIYNPENSSAHDIKRWLAE